MNPVLVAQFRRQWVLVLGVLVFLIFLLVHLLVFQPSVMCTGIIAPATMRNA